MQDQARWLDERRRGIGGSDVAAILGLSPFKTALQVYQEKRKEVEDWQGSDVTDWGRRLEVPIREWYAEHTGRAVRLPDKILYNTKYPFMLATLDGYTDDNRVVEIKTARSGKGWGDPGSSEIPDYYALQVQHYLIVTGFEVADVPVSIAGSPPKLYEVPADKELHEMIIEAEAAFWHRVETGNPPDPVTFADALRKYGGSKAQGLVIATESVLSTINDLRGVREEIASLEAREEALKAAIIIAIGDAGSDLVDSLGNVLATYRMGTGRKVFDHKTLEKQMPEIYKKYLKHTEPQRRFILK